MLLGLLYLCLLGCVATVIVLLMHMIGTSTPMALQITTCWFVLWVSIDILFVHQSQTAAALNRIERRLEKTERSMHGIKLALTSSNTF